jgi:hypothetical protein
MPFLNAYNNLKKTSLRNINHGKNIDSIIRSLGGFINIENQPTKGFCLFREAFTIISEPEEQKFLVVMYTFENDHTDPITIADTEDKAQEYIDKEMKDKVYIGTGVYKIMPIKVYK